MKNKYKQKMWDEYFNKEKKIHILPKSGIFKSYDIYLCDEILKKYLPKYVGEQKNKIKICEIGSGDGKLVKKIADMFNYDPYGIEYSKPAIRSARKIGVNVIEGDVFNTKILKKYKNKFDIVFSYGFIEHIIPPDTAVDIHLDLLKENGIYIIQIPRLKGFNYWKTQIFRPDLIPLHNLTIMDEQIMAKICKRKNSKTLFCKNYGTFKIRLALDKKNIRYYLLRAFCLLEFITNPLLRLLFKKHGFETKFFSPAVMYIGKKLETSSLKS